MENAKVIFEADFVAEKEELKSNPMHKNIIDLIREAEAIDKASSDLTVTQKDIIFHPDFQIQIQLQNHNGAPYTKHMSLTPYSFSQVCSRLGIPPAYAKNLMKLGREDLLIHNLNELMQSQEENRTFLVRETDSYVRAFLSHRYSVLDSSMILRMAEEIIPKSYHIDSSFITPERLHVRYLGERLDIPNEDLYVGIQIDSSDVGRKNLSIDFFIYKQICTNGLKVARFQSDIFKKVHLGNNLNELMFYRAFKKGIAEIETYVTNMREEILLAIYTTVTEVEFKKMYEKTKKVFSIREDEQEVRAVMNKYGNNKFSYVNALTEIAQRYTLDRRLEIEEFAGELLVA